MKEQFTKGDWHCNEFNILNNSIQYVRSDKIEICILFNGVDVNAANAHLIAAAPKMYRMLKEISEASRLLGYKDEEEMINNLLAEARGENKDTD